MIAAPPDLGQDLVRNHRLNVRVGPSAWSIAIGFAVLCIIWGEFPITAKIGTSGQPPFLVAGSRFVLAGLILGLAARLRGTSLRLDRGYLSALFLISMSMIGIPSAIFFWAVQHAQASVLTLVWCTAPLFICLINARNPGESQSWKTALGLLAGFGGVVQVVAAGSGLAMSGDALIAELAVAASALLYAVGFQQVRSRTREGDILVLTSWQLLFAGSAILLLSLLTEHRLPAAPSSANVASFVFLVLACSCITFSLTTWLIRHLGTVRTGYNELVTPAITVVVAAPQLGEPLTGHKVLGLVLMVVGLVLVMPRGRSVSEDLPIAETAEGHIGRE